MGFFGKKKSKEADTQPGAVYVGGMEDGTLPIANAPKIADDDLPVATPIDAICVAAPQHTTHMKYDQQNMAAPQYAAPMHQNTRNSMQGDTTFTRHPCLLPECPHCHCESRTKVITYPNLITWFVAVVLLFIFWPICWIPLVLDKTKQTDHYCALCQRQVGSVMPFGDCCEKRRH